MSKTFAFAVLVALSISALVNADTIVTPKIGGGAVTITGVGMIDVAVSFDGTKLAVNVPSDSTPVLRALPAGYAFASGTAWDLCLPARLTTTSTAGTRMTASRRPRCLPAARYGCSFSMRLPACRLITGRPAPRPIIRRSCNRTMTHGSGAALACNTTLTRCSLQPKAFTRPTTRSTSVRDNGRAVAELWQRKRDFYLQCHAGSRTIGDRPDWHGCGVDGDRSSSSSAGEHGVTRRTIGVRRWRNRPNPMPAGTARLLRRAAASFGQIDAPLFWRLLRVCNSSVTAKRLKVPCGEQT